MFEYLKGIVTKIDPAYIVLDVNGVGYKILCPTPYSYDENQPATIYVEQVVRDTGITLYGFLSLEDKELFLKLLSKIPDSFPRSRKKDCFPDCLRLEGKTRRLCKKINCCCRSYSKSARCFTCLSSTWLYPKRS